jgi:hypothetical protein
MIDFNKSKKVDHRRMMLWIEEDILGRIEVFRPQGVTLQECIRLLVSDALVRHEKSYYAANARKQSLPVTKKAAN